MNSWAQSFEALDYANEVRLSRAAVKRNLRAGTITFAEALADDAVSSMPVGKLVCCVPSWGPRKVQKLCKRIGVSESRRVDELWAHHRASLIAGVDGSDVL